MSFLIQSVLMPALESYATTHMAQVAQKVFSGQESVGVAKQGSLHLMHLAQLVTGIFFAIKHVSSAPAKIFNKMSVGDIAGAIQELVDTVGKVMQDLQIFTVNATGAVAPNLINRLFEQVTGKVETKAA